MRGFFKALFASCLGTILALGFVFLLAFSIISTLGVKKDKADPKSVLLLNFNEFIPEKTGNVREEFFVFSSGDFIGLDKITRAIQFAAEDPNIEGISIQTPIFSSGQATLQTIRKSLEDFKKSGKFIYAYNDFYTQGAYWLSSVADSVFLNPNGMVDMRGMGVSLMYFTGLLEKTGIEMNVFYAGKFKSATEPFRRSDISPENKEQLKEFLDNLEMGMLADISQSRDLEISALKDIIRDYTGGQSESALTAGLIDELIYSSEYQDKVKRSIGLGENKKINYIKLPQYVDFLPLQLKSNTKDRIAIVYAEGEIVMGESKKGIISETRYERVFDRVKKDKNVKAVVLRVNSPGGNSLVSDNIHSMIEDLKSRNIPVIASFGDYAASGGYYISVGADTIVTEANTLTGSIGVFSIFPYFGNMLSDKLGITFDTVKTAPMAVSFDPSYKLSDQEARYLQMSTDNIYRTFVKRVSDGRSMSVEEVEEVAQGRIWSGTRAVELGLADVIGSLDDAVLIAAEKAGINEYRIVEYPFIKEHPFKAIIENLLSEEDQVKLAGRLSNPFVIKYMELIKIIESRQPQARFPYILTWN